MDGYFDLPLAMYAMTIVTLTQSILPTPVYKLANGLFEIFTFPIPILSAHPHAVSQPPTRTIATQGAIDFDNVHLNRTPDHICFCILSIFCFSVGIQLVLCRANRNTFFSSGFNIYVGCVAKIYEILTPYSLPLYTCSALAIAIVKILSKFDAENSTTTADSVHNFVIFVESLFRDPFNTLLVVATVLSHSICSAIGNMIFTNQTTLFRTKCPILPPIVKTFPSYITPLVELIIPSDSLLFPSDILTFWVISNMYTPNFALGVIVLACSATIELLLQVSDQQITLSTGCGFEEFDWNQSHCNPAYLLAIDIPNVVDDLQNIVLFETEVDTLPKDDRIDTIHVCVDADAGPCDGDMGTHPAAITCFNHVSLHESHLDIVHPESPTHDNLALVTVIDTDPIGLQTAMAEFPVPPAISAAKVEQDVRGIALVTTDIYIQPLDAHAEFDTSIDVPSCNTEVELSGSKETNLNPDGPALSVQEETMLCSGTDVGTFAPAISSVEQPISVENSEQTMNLSPPSNSPDALAKVNLAIEMKIKELESLFNAMDESIERVNWITRPLSPIASNPPSGKPYIWAKVKQPPRLWQQRRGAVV